MVILSSLSKQADDFLDEAMIMIGQGLATLSNTEGATKDDVLKALDSTIWALQEFKVLLNDAV